MKRLRIFAGPNGSGKSTIIDIVSKKGIDLGIYCNADDYKRSINATHSFDFDSLNMKLSKEDLIQSLKQSNLYIKMDGDFLLSKLIFDKKQIAFFT